MNVLDHGHDHPLPAIKASEISPQAATSTCREHGLRNALDESVVTQPRPPDARDAYLRLITSRRGHNLGNLLNGFVDTLPQPAASREDHLRSPWSVEAITRSIFSAASPLLLSTP